MNILNSIDNLINEAIGHSIANGAKFIGRKSVTATKNLTRAGRNGLGSGVIGVGLAGKHGIIEPAKRLMPEDDY